MAVSPAALSRAANSPANCSVAMETSNGRHRWHWAKAISTFRPAANEATANRSAYRSMMEKALDPIEPGEPRMQLCFNASKHARNTVESIERTTAPARPAAAHRYGRGYLHDQAAWSPN